MNFIVDFTLYNIVMVIIVLSVLIFCHELGHFLLAKLFKVKVLKFALGFGHRIVWKQIGDTEYSIRWILLGGFVKLLGEDDDEEMKKLPPEEAARALDRQSVLKKIAILAAGSIFNLILAVLIFTGTYLFRGEEIYHLRIKTVILNEPAQKAGFLSGDFITKVDGKIIKTPFLREYLLFKAGIPVQMTVLRNGELLNIKVIPREEPVEIAGEIIKIGYIGIESEEKVVEEVPLGPFDSLLRGVQKTWSVIEFTLVALKRLLQGQLPASSVGGILQIGKTVGDVARHSIFDVIPITAILSITIGLLNLFPIPILDGSLIVLALIEAIRGKSLSNNQKEWIFKIGLAMIIALMLFATKNDIVRFLKN